MKKHLLYLATYLVACFSIFLTTAAANSNYTPFKSNYAAHYDKVSTPYSEKNSHVPFTLTVDVEVTEDDLTQNIQRDDLGETAFNEFEFAVDHCYLTKLLLTSPSVNAFQETRLPYFILYHSWKSDIS